MDPRLRGDGGLKSAGYKLISNPRAIWLRL
jgi:hypothetical protein